MKLDLKKQQFSWRDGYHAKVDATKAAKELASISKTIKGDITAEDVVARAMDSENVLHPQFTWNDKKAANEWRLHEARCLIGALHVTFIEAPNVTVRQYSIYASDDGNVYMPTSYLMQREDDRKFVLEQALAELRSFERKYKDLVELSQVIDQIREVLSQGAKKGRKAAAVVR